MLANGEVIIDVGLDETKVTKGLKSLKGSFTKLGGGLAALGASGVKAMSGLVKSTGELNTDLAKMRANAEKELIIDVDLDKTKVNKGLKSLEISFAKVGGGLAALGVAGVAAMSSLVEATAELNTDLARLRANAENAGFGFDAMEGNVKKVAAVSGELDSAVETVSNLMQTDFSDNQLGEALDYINGAAIRFSDTLNTEGIADGLQETFATGEAIGQFGELLERSGVDLDVFNKGLANAAANGTETDYVLQQLAATGLSDTYEQYLQSNEEIVAYNKANIDLQVALADLGKIFTPLITASKEFLTNLIGLVTGAVSFKEFTESIIGDLSVITKKFDGVNFGGFSNNLEKARKTGENILNAIVSFTSSKLSDIKRFWEENGNQILSAVNNAFKAIKAVIDFVMPAIKLVIEIAWNAIKNIINGALDLIMGSVKVFSGLFTGDFSKMWEGIKQVFIGAINLIMGLLTVSLFGAIRTLFVNLGKTLINIVKNNWSSITSSFSTGIANVLANLRNFVPNAVNNFKTLGTNSLNAMKSLPSKFTQIGKDMIQGLINGIKNMTTKAIGAITGVVDGVVNKAKGMLGINSPSKLFDQYGQWIDEGLERGINRKSNLPKNATSDMVSDLTSSFINPLKNAKIGLGTLATPSQSTINNIVNNGNAKTETPNINPAPVLLNGKVIGEVAFEYVNKKQQSAYSISSIAKGVT